MRKECEDYLKKYFMNGPQPEGVEGHKPSEEQWNAMPRPHIEWMIDLVLGFGSGSSPLLDKILAEYNKKSHSDLSFGMEVKNLIYASKTK